MKRQDWKFQFLINENGYNINNIKTSPLLLIPDDLINYIKDYQFKISNDFFKEYNKYIYKNEDNLSIIKYLYDNCISRNLIVNFYHLYKDNPSINNPSINYGISLKDLEIENSCYCYIEINNENLITFYVPVIRYIGRKTKDINETKRVFNIIKVTIKEINKKLQRDKCKEKKVFEIDSLIYLVNNKDDKNDKVYNKIRKINKYLVFTKKIIFDIFGLILYAKMNKFYLKTIQNHSKSFNTIKTVNNNQQDSITIKYLNKIPNPKKEYNKQLERNKDPNYHVREHYRFLSADRYKNNSMYKKYPGILVNEGIGKKINAVEFRTIIKQDENYNKVIEGLK